jgi:hypothetical protein
MHSGAGENCQFKALINNVGIGCWRGCGILRLGLIGFVWVCFGILLALIGFVLALIGFVLALIGFELGLFFPRSPSVLFS